MSRAYRYFRMVLLGGALVSPILISGCAARVGYRVYDPEYGDYHVWNHDEIVYYQQWEVDTHRHHKDFDKRNKEEQKEYWEWRHHHGGNH